AMPFIQCSVGGCDKKLQPILKVDPRVRDTWLYRECDECLNPVCEKHSSEIGGRIICNRCRKQEGHGLAVTCPPLLLDPSDVAFVQRPVCLIAGLHCGALRGGGLLSCPKCKQRSCPNSEDEYNTEAGHQRESQSLPATDRASQVVDQFLSRSFRHGLSPDCP